jgi:hypothetical protein
LTHKFALNQEIYQARNMGCKAKMHQQAKLSVKLGSSGYLDYWA